MLQHHTVTQRVNRVAVRNDNEFAASRSETCTTGMIRLGGYRVEYTYISTSSRDKTEELTWHVHQFGEPNMISIECDNIADYVDAAACVEL